MKQQSTDGILIVDKPENISSAAVVDRVKKSLKVKKAGHAGTLDPFATGILICLTGKATRLSRFFLHGNKTYRATLRLGLETDTQDALGNVLRTDEKFHFDPDTLETVFDSFKGTIEQVPPVYSALKHKGTPLYKLARKGQPVVKPPRSVHIEDIRILNTEIPDILFEVTCSAGTYIRTLAADIGKKLGCGACLIDLKRIESCGFTIEEAIGLEQIEKENREFIQNHFIIDMANALRHMESLSVDEPTAQKIFQGRPITSSDFKPLNNNGYLKIMNGNKDNLLAVMEKKKDEDRFRYICVFPEKIDTV